MRQARTSELKFRYLLLFGLASGAVGGLLFQIGFIIVSRSSFATAVFSLVLVLYTIPAGVIVGLTAALLAGIVSKVIPLASHGLHSVLTGGGALIGAAIAAEVIGDTFSLAPPPHWPAVVIGIVSGIGFGVFVLLWPKT